MTESPKQKAKLGLPAVIAIGIGGMVGGGIFAVLGLASQLARGGTPEAFALAGLVALVTSYSYSRLSVTYPSRGGTVKFINTAFGRGRLTGSLNILLWLSYVVMLSLYAHAFGSYAASFVAQSAQPLWRHVFASAAVVLLTVLNAIGAKAVGRLETWIVAAKVAILALFVAAGFGSIEASRLSFAAWSGPINVVAGGIVIFIAYEGFELIANTAEDVRDAEKILPRAYLWSVLFVILLYVSVAAVTVGNLPLPKIVAARDYALAAAAKPFLGQSGFILIAIAAMLSTASAINATLYGSARLSWVIAQAGELPAFLERKVWDRPIEGLIITTLLTLVLANALNLSSISVTGSGGFLIIFGAVNIAAIVRRREAKVRLWISFTGAVLCAGALVALVWERASTAPQELYVLPGMIVLAVAIELVYRAFTGREICCD